MTTTMGIEQEELQWYVLRAVSGQEKKIKTYLENEIHRHGYEKEVPQLLVPSEVIYEMRGGKKRQREKNFYPGYILVQANLNDPEVAHTLINVPGVAGFLGARGEGTRTPQPMRKQEVNRLLGKLDELETEPEQVEHFFTLGEQVKVMDGPFSGFTGEIDSIQEDKRKLRVMVKIFGRATPIELNFFQVEKTMS